MPTQADSDVRAGRSSARALTMMPEYVTCCNKYVNVPPGWGWHGRP
jgi:hypothetical protein